MKKRKAAENFSGISICDSIVVSVKKKRKDVRRIESLIIAVIGFVSVILSFLQMFSFRYHANYVVYAAVVFSCVYALISLAALSGKKGTVLYLASVGIFGISLYRSWETIVEGFKFTYNTIYKASHYTEINYYKFLEHRHEMRSITIFFIFCIWLLAIVLYYFTICKPNPIPTVIVTFPIIEIGLYNGIKIPIFWGMLTVAYWFAVLAVCTIDIGEYSGGNGGFVRKGNLFFPKRQMKLKVTEKCAMLIIGTVAVVTVVSLGAMKVLDYKRSEKLNERRTAIKEAVNSFTVEDLAASISNLTESFGFTFEYESHKLGDTSHISYKNSTDLVVTFDRQYDGAVYLKGYAGAVYHDNEWFDLDESAYNKASELFGNFRKYGIYPQDFPHIFTKYAKPAISDSTVWIESNKNRKTYAPYITDNYGGFNYKKDTVITSEKKNSLDYSYKFLPLDCVTASSLLGRHNRSIVTIDGISDDEWRSYISDYAQENGLFIDSSDMFNIDYDANLDSSIDPESDGKFIMTSLLENEYRDFVYKNYLQIPDNQNLTDVRDLFGDILDTSSSSDSAEDKIELLYKLRERVQTMAVYSLSPGKTPSSRDFVNYFLTENHKGYCTHFATTGVMLARMAGIPARYATGYIIVGNDFCDENKNSDGTYTVKVLDNRSHAWTEVYLDGYGWIPFEFTSGYSEQAIQTDTTTTPSAATTKSTATTTKKPKSSTESSKKKTTGSQHTTKATHATTAVSTKQGTAKKHNSAASDNLTDSQKNIIFAVIMVAVIVGTVTARRRIILGMRRKKLNSGSVSGRVVEAYRYYEALLSYLEIEQEDMTYTEFADYIESQLGSKYFKPDSMKQFMQTALKYSFSDSAANTADAEYAKDFVNGFASELCKASGAFSRFSIKYIHVLK